LIGHNSAGLDLDGEQFEPPQTAPIVVQPAQPPGPTIAELAARAASIQAAHIADSRKRLTAFTVTAAAPAAVSGAPVETLFESKPAKTRKKKHRKEK
jgi:hypothetical protein